MSYVHKQHLLFGYFELSFIPNGAFSDEDMWVVLIIFRFYGNSSDKYTAYWEYGLNGVLPLLVAHKASC